MDFLEKIRILSGRIAERQKHIQTEEATKQSFVIPLISALGYDVHDPRELIPEYTADVGTKKGEKVDYAIMKGGQPVILIECKMPSVPLDDKANLDQLIRYFGVTKARIAVLTNGILYRFFTDLDDKNLMDQKPFLAFSLLDIQNDEVAELQRFCNDRFDIDQIVSAAAQLKYSKMIKSFLTEQSRSPSDKFVQFLATHVCNEKPTVRVMQQIRDATKRAMGQLYNSHLSEIPKSPVMLKEDQREPPQIGQTTAAKTDKEKQKLETTYKPESKRTSISEEQFFEKIRQIDSSLVTPLRVFLDRLASLGITAKFGDNSLILRWLIGGQRKMNFGSIKTTGHMSTNACNWVPGELGRIDIGHDYLNRLAALTPGASVKKFPNQAEWKVVKENKEILISDLLCHTDEWFRLIEDTQNQLTKALS
ncbi:MAG: type I restriction enzyme HsdR N-terminal domain-containing protein [Magnetococcus sp. XQGC-1]